MARFVRGNGTRTESREIQQFRTLVRARDHSGSTAVLPGFLHCESELGARIEIERLVASWIAKGFVPEDAEAEEFVSALPAPAAPTEQAVWPLRSDVHVANESYGFVVSSLSTAGTSIEESSEAWKAAVLEGKFIPLSLSQVDSFNVRVVGGEALSESETNEWVACLEWPLDIPDGCLALTGGAILTSEDYRPNDSYFESYIETVKVPPGKYRVKLYSYLPGVNGDTVLDQLARGYGNSGPYGAWWRANREGESFPTWLRQWCVDDPSNDPGHEDEWEGVEYLSDEEVPEMIDFLVHLTPDSQMESPKSFDESDGWFALETGARRPECCPRGLEAKDLLHQGDSADNVFRNWIYVQEVIPLVEPLRPTPIQGGEVSISPSQLAQLYRLARLSCAYSLPHFRAKGELRDCQPFEVKQACILLVDSDQLDLYFSDDARPSEHQDCLTELATWLAELPVGTQWELACAPADPEALDAERLAGFHRYLGVVTETGWVVQQSYPEVSTESLASALQLALEVDSGQTIKLRDSAEAQQVTARAQVDYGAWLEDNEVVLSAEGLSLNPPDPTVLEVYGSAVFACRFGDIWPIYDHSEDDDDEDDFR